MHKAEGVLEPRDLVVTQIVRINYYYIQKAVSNNSRQPFLYISVKVLLNQNRFSFNYIIFNVFVRNEITKPIRKNPDL